MIKLKDYLINKDEVLYIEKYAHTLLIVHFKNNAPDLCIEYYEEAARDNAFEIIKF